MKWFSNIASQRVAFVSTFVTRRRERQAASRNPNALTFAVAEANVRILMTMAAADDKVERAEIAEVLAYVERVSLRPADVENLRQSVARLATAPPLIDDVAEPLAIVATHRARANTLVTDLARVATSVDNQHPRKLMLMEMVCDQLGVFNPLARLTADWHDVDTAAPVARVREGLDLATDRRIRDSVAAALERASDLGSTVY